MQQTKNAAILFEPDGYVVTGNRIMGRQAAGNSFLRAAVAHAGDDPLWCYTPNTRSAEHFQQLARSIDPKVKTEWCPAHLPARLKEAGTLYLPGPNLDSHASRRLRVGVGAYSLCGVTHTTASHNAMEAIASLLTAPVTPWDALICTSTAVRSTVDTIIAAERELLEWRLGTTVNPELPQLPVIPLGIQCDDFDFSADAKAAARQKLQCKDDETVFLFVGRLSYHAKAHPHAMMLALEAVARNTGKAITLVQCGWFANANIEKAFKTAAAETCPSVRCLFTDGKDVASRNTSWAAADAFISLSDNHQETFGITPIEAMAASLPVIVSDWDGYKDTVPDGITGFRIPTWTLENDSVHNFAMRHDAGVDSYDRYCGYTCQTVAIDQQALQDRIADLVTRPDLRAKLGAAGRSHARNTYDWAVIYKQYLALWADLAERRAHALTTPAVTSAPTRVPTRMDPYKAFASYPTHKVSASTKVRVRTERPVEQYFSLLQTDMFNYAAPIMPNKNGTRHIFAALEAQGEMSVQQIAQGLSAREGSIAFAVSVFAKMGLVSLSQD